MKQPFRLSAGGRIDRSELLSFRFDGRLLSGLRGDTLASALLANGVHLVGRSFKYHRPRGIMSAGAEEPNALVTLDRDHGRVEPNSRATQVALFDGLRASSQNRWPSLAFDVGAIADHLSPLFAAGFYYRTFKWPNWHWFEGAIRHAAGLGRVPCEADPDHYANRFAHCDVLIVGAGPAGIAAALASAETGARVIVCDEQEEFGGSLLATPGERIDDKAAWTWLDEATRTLQAFPNVRLLPRATVFGIYAQGSAGVLQRNTDHLADPPADAPRQTLWQIRARRIVLAAGAIERPLLFPDNDRPGILLAHAGKTYVDRYGVLPGRRAVFCTNNDSAYEAAFTLADAGGSIACIADARSSIPADLKAEAARRGIELLSHHVPHATKGRLRVSAIALAQRGSEHGQRPRWVDCDLVLMSGGWTPTVHLYAQAGGKPVWNADSLAFQPAGTARLLSPVGACSGRASLDECLADGFAAGVQASRETGRTCAVARVAPTCSSHGRDEGRDERVLSIGADKILDRAFVDFQNDVTSNDIRLAVQEGFRSIEHVKRYTTTGMATDQGKTSGTMSLMIVADALGSPVPLVGQTKFRPPYTPVTFGALAAEARGRFFDPVRLTPTHDWAAAHNAAFEDMGQWKRARYFPRPGEDMHAAVIRECRAVRSSVGLFDASTLGKIEVVGPDAAEFMNRIYVNSFDRLGVGRCRYGLMLREDGYVLDDGVVGRLAQNHYYVSTSTGGAQHVLHMMEDYRQTEYPELKVWLTPVTEQWAVLVVTGPKARDSLAPLVDIPLTIEAFPRMAVRHARICGVEARLHRVSFTGELGFEVHVPADYGRPVWDAILNAGQKHGVTPYGTETMRVLRAEKGHIIIGQETDGTVTPYDLGLEWAIGKAKGDFVGKRSLARPMMLSADRKQLVGLLTRDRRTVIEEGAQLTEQLSRSAPGRSVGHITSAYWSATLGQPIALALVRGGRQRLGSTLWATAAERNVEVEVVSPLFYDPEGQRLDG